MMTNSTARPPIKLAIVGLGSQGTQIARLALDLGYDLVGAADVGEKVGSPLNSIVDHPDVSDRPVQGSIEELLASIEKPDVIVLSALVTPEELVTMATPLLRDGINVLSLEAVLFDGRGPLVEELDAAARAGGASMSASGMQDLWWVHLPALAASACHRITQIQLDDFSNCARFPEAVGVYEAALNTDPADFDAWAAPHLDAPPIQGGPMLSLARVLGLTPGDMRVKIEPITQPEPANWFAADVEIEPGKIVGVRYVAEFTTAEGIEFVGHLRFQVEDASHTSINRIVISGDTELVIEMPQFALPLYVPVGLVRRIPDVIDARPGFVPVAELAGPRYEHPSDQSIAPSISSR